MGWAGLGWAEEDKNFRGVNIPTFIFLKVSFGPLTCHSLTKNSYDDLYFNPKKMNFFFFFEEKKIYE